MKTERTLTVTLPTVMVEYLERMADESSISVSEYLEIILDEEMAEMDSTDRESASHE